MFPGNVTFKQNRALLTSACRTLGERVNALSHAAAARRGRKALAAAAPAQPRLTTCETDCKHSSILNSFRLEGVPFTALIQIYCFTGISRNRGVYILTENIKDFP